MGGGGGGGTAKCPVAPWFQQVGRSRDSTIQNSLFGSRTLSHVNNSDTVRASIAKMADLGQTSGEHARENGFLLEKMQKDAAKFGISVKHELYERRL